MIPVLSLCSLLVEVSSQLMTMITKMATCHVIIILLPVTSHGHLLHSLLSCPTIDSHVSVMSLCGV